MSAFVYRRGTTSCFVYRKAAFVKHNNGCIGRKIRKYILVIAWGYRRAINHGALPSSRFPLVAMLHGIEGAEAIPLFVPELLKQHKMGLMQQLFPQEVG